MFSFSTAVPVEVGGILSGNVTRLCHITHILMENKHTGMVTIECLGQDDAKDKKDFFKAIYMTGSPELT